jgi:hypothetical protein
MDSKLKADWIAALRSGKYRQGRHELITEKGAMCCLGVLCSVMDPDNVAGWNGMGVPPNDLRDEADLHSDDIYVFVEANDSYRWTFKRIADYIEGML